jgi:hypothetical protein
MTRNALENSGRVAFRSVVAVVVALRGPEACGLFKQDVGLVLAWGWSARKGESERPLDYPLMTLRPSCSSVSSK